jgi:hypothetical protein
MPNTRLKYVSQNIKIGQSMQGREEDFSGALVAVSILAVSLLPAPRRNEHATTISD